MDWWSTYHLLKVINSCYLLMTYLLKHEYIFLESLKHLRLSRISKRWWKIKVVLCSDPGCEYIEISFKMFCEDHCIYHSLTTPMSHQQNGIVRRKNRDLLEMTRSMLKTKKYQRSSGMKMPSVLYICWIVIQLKMCKIWISNKHRMDLSHV